MQTQQVNKSLQVRNNSGFTWCGPAALSAALGITTQEAKQRINSASLRRWTKGVTYSEMRHALLEAGAGITWDEFPRDAKDCPTLGNWLNTRVTGDTYVVCITGHWITVQGDWWVDSHYMFGRHITDCPFLKAKVRHAIRLVEQPPADQ